MVWTEGTTSPYIIHLDPIVLSKEASGEAISSVDFSEFHRLIILRDSINQSSLSLELSTPYLLTNQGGSEMVDFVPVNDTMNYSPEQILPALETQSFVPGSDVVSLSIDRVVRTRDIDSLVDHGRIRFELVNVSTGEVLASFGTLGLIEPGDSLTVADSVSLSMRRIPRVPLKVRTVVDNLVLTGDEISGAIVNQYMYTDGTASRIYDSEPLRPSALILDQNFPNPFNPTTTIKYDLPTDSPVRLKVYDILGREVLSLVDGVETAGRHEVTLNASDLSSGVYFYRLKARQKEGGQAGDFTDTKRLLLLK